MRAESPPRQDAVGLVIDVARFEREQQVVQFDAIDSKAGGIIGFAGVVLGIIAAIVATENWAWGLAYVPATVAGAHAIYHASEAMRVRKVARQEPRASYAAWVSNKTSVDSELQVARDEVRTLELNNPIVQEKVEALKRAQGAFSTGAYLIVAGIFVTLAARGVELIASLK